MPTGTLSFPSPDATLDRWRRDTPGCRDRIHLNNAGAALMPAPVLETLTRYLEREATIGGYEAADEAAARVGDIYESVAWLLGAAARNVALVENATVAFAQALSAFDFRPGDRIVTTRADYVSNQLMYLSLARRVGVETVRADDLPEGGTDPESVRRLARHPRTKLVALTWVPTNSGLVQDAPAVGAVCAELGVPYLVDACQAVGQMAVDVRALGCDFLAATGRKLERGPAPFFLDMRGADWTDPDAFRLTDGARRFEKWELAYALTLGLGAAVRYALEVGRAGQERAWRLAARLRERLAGIPGAIVLDRGSTRCAIVTVAVAGRDAAELKRRLRARGINTSVSDRQDAVLDMDDKHVTAALRLSPHYYNTEDDLDAAAGALAELARG